VRLKLGEYELEYTQVGPDLRAREASPSEAETRALLALLPLLRAQGLSPLSVESRAFLPLSARGRFLFRVADERGRPGEVEGRLYRGRPRLD
jgi:hypothetical protein